ncbi:MAG TPA: response regulator [Candidatus Binatia bacterium]|jgi:signal transduction histidine kinase
MKPNVLAIDDDPIILDMYEAVLDAEHTIHLASSGEEGLALLNSNPRIDLLLLDIVMPGMDGYQTCQRIRQNPLFSHMKVILVSSKVKLEERLRGYQAGADDYVTKPFEASELLAKIKVFLRLKTAEEIDRIKTNFITLFNHEARTPLTTIFGYVALLEQSPNLSSDDKEFLRKIMNSGTALLRSSEKTVLLSNLKSGATSIERQSIHLASFLAQCEAGLTREAEQKQVFFQQQDSNGLSVSADPKLLAIAVHSILDNAVKFARTGSSINVNVEAEANRVRIEVGNEGDPIAPEIQETIFDELSIRDLEHHHEGHGLSLAIARRIVETHGGALSVRNCDCGPVFTLSLPR